MVDEERELAAAGILDDHARQPETSAMAV